MKEAKRVINLYNTAWCNINGLSTKNMTTNKENSSPSAQKTIADVLFYWHRHWISHDHWLLQEVCVISATNVICCFQRSWSCQPITAHELPSAGQSIANYGSPLMRTEQCFDQGSKARRDSTSFSPDHWTVAPAVHLEQQVFPTTGSSQIHLACSRHA